MPSRTDELVGEILPRNGSIYGGEECAKRTREGVKLLGDEPRKEGADIAVH